MNIFAFSADVLLSAEGSGEGCLKCRKEDGGFEKCLKIECVILFFSIFFSKKKKKKVAKIVLVFRLQF